MRLLPHEYALPCGGYEEGSIRGATSESYGSGVGLVNRLVLDRLDSPSPHLATTRGLAAFLSASRIRHSATESAGSEYNPGGSARDPAKVLAYSQYSLFRTYPLVNRFSEYGPQSTTVLGSLGSSVSLPQSF